MKILESKFVKGEYTPPSTLHVSPTKSPTRSPHLQQLRDALQPLLVEVSKHNHIYILRSKVVNLVKSCLEKRKSKRKHQNRKKKADKVDEQTKAEKRKKIDNQNAEKRKKACKQKANKGKKADKKTKKRKKTEKRKKKTKPKVCIVVSNYS